MHFTGPHFTGWAFDNKVSEGTATSITINGYNSGTLVGTSSMGLSADRYDWLQADIANITSLEFISSADFEWWLMDDFTFKKVSTRPGTSNNAALWYRHSSFW